MKALLGFLLILSSIGFENNALAGEGWCDARDSENGAKQAYCKSFEETPCRMNSHLCIWTPVRTDQGHCEPNDETNVAYASYCEIFDEVPCRMNSNLCHWMRH